MKKKSVWILLFLFMLVFSFIPEQVHACSKLYSTVGFTEERFIQSSFDVVVAKASKATESKELTWQGEKQFDYDFDVVEVLRGDANRKNLKLLSYESPSASDSSYGYGPDCNNFGGFKIGQKYLIFVGADFGKGISRIKDENDSWLLKVRRQLKMKTKLKRSSM